MNAAIDSRAPASSAVTVGDIAHHMEQLAPPALSEAWDNTGLLLGDREARVCRLMTCLTLTLESVQEAIDRKADLVIAHHPLPFKPLSRITTDSIPGKLLWMLARQSVAVYSPHTSWDSAAEGINYQLAGHIGLNSILPLVEFERNETRLEQRPNSSADPPISTTHSPIALGAGRCGSFTVPIDFNALASRIASRVPNCRLRGVDCGKPIQKVAVACGSGGSFISAAALQKCDLLVTGEATFHNCLEAQAMRVSLLMIGHFASEKFAMVQLADLLRSRLDGIETWSSQHETDPVMVVDRGELC